jgi:hypothetical protein
MNKLDILKSRLEMAAHNLMCCSINYSMDTPNPRYEKEWRAAKDEVALLGNWIVELTSGDPAAGPWQFTEPTDNGWYIIRRVHGKLMQYYVGTRIDSHHWQAEGYGIIPTKQIVAWAPLNALWEDPSHERRCRVCGCTDDLACPGGCHWVETDLCSRCMEGHHEINLLS